MNEQAAGAQAMPPSVLDASFANVHPASRMERSADVWDVKPVNVTPMILDPGNVTKHDLYTDEDAGYVARAVEALGALHNAAAQVIQARQDLGGDPTMTEAAKVLALDAMHSKLSAAALPKVDTARQHLESAIVATEQGLRQPLKDGGASPLGSEIRSYVRSLDASARNTLLMEAITSGDSVTASAVLGCPAPYLSGLNAEMVRALTQQWHRARQPGVVRRLDLMRHAHAKLEQAAGEYMRGADSLLGSKHTTVSRLRAVQGKTRRVIGAIA